MAIKKRPISPRQKMINLLYVVLMAMLALNVSTEVLEGFSVVEDSLKRTISGSTKQNEALYDVFASQLKSNPEKVKAWFDKAEGVKRASARCSISLKSLRLQSFARPMGTMPMYTTL